MKVTNPARVSFTMYLTIAVVLLVGIGGAVYAGITSSRNIKTSLLERTESIAALVSADDISHLAGHESDLDLPVYQQLKSDLMQVREVNHDIRFIYILALNKDNNVLFHVDSEPPESEDYSPPGQLYPEDEGETASVYEEGRGIILPITSDRWGTWLSAFSPIKNDQGEVVAVLGLDVPARSYYQQVAINAVIPLLLTIIIIIVLLWIRRRAAYQQRFLADKAFFLSFASHEIRSPLTSIAWALKPLVDKHSADHRRLQKIDDSMHHILATIDDVLSLQATEGVRDKPLNKKPVIISDVIDSLIASLRLFAEEHDTRMINATDQANQRLAVSVDSLLFKRVVSNFLVNSVKYSPDHTTVTVEVTEQAKTWTVSIHNEGDGLSREDQQKIMQGFYRTKSAEASGQKGTGLGVMLSRDIIARHKGKLELESHKAKGVTFRIIMPL